jgi:hypothetical protein
MSAMIVKSHQFLFQDLGEKRGKMTTSEIVDFLKAQYPRKTRKQLVSRLLEAESAHKVDELIRIEKLINQIFSYVLKELGWTMVTSAKNWDDTALEVMRESFPQIEHSRWYQNLDFTPQKEIDVIMDAK